MPTQIQTERRKNRVHAATDEPRSEGRFVDMRVPLPWLLTSAAGIMVTLGMTTWNIAGQTGKLDQLIVSNLKLEKRIDERDLRLELLKDKLNMIERTQDSVVLRLEAYDRGRAAATR